MKFLKASAFVFVGKAITLITTLILTPILVRFLGSDGYGDYAFMISVLGVSMIFVNGGLYEGLRKYIGEEAQRNSNWRNQIFAYYVRYGLFVAVISSIFLYLLIRYGYVSRILGDRFDTYFYMLILLILFRQTFKIFRGALFGVSKEKHSEILRIIQEVSFSLFAIVLLYHSASVEAVLLSHIIAMLLVFLTGFYFITNNFNLQYLFIPLSDIKGKQLITYNFGSVLIMLFMTTLYHLDIILLQPISGSQDTGYYRAALTIAEFLWFIPIVFQTVLIHSMSHLWAEGDIDKINSVSTKVTRYSLFITTILAIGIAVLSQDFMTVYFGQNFHNSVVPLLILLPGTIAFGLARPIISIGQGKENLTPIIIAVLSSSIINFVLNLYLIPIYGMHGAAVATSIGYSSMLMFSYISARHMGYNPLSEVRLKSLFISSFLTIFSLIIIYNLIPIKEARLLIIPPVGFVLYIFLLMYSGGIDNEEIIVTKNFLNEKIFTKEW